MSQPHGTPLERIRAATQALHERIDTGPFALAVLSGTLPISRYASYLRGLHAVYGGLEHALELFGTDTLRAAYRLESERRARLERDLAQLRCDLHGVDAAVLQAMVLVQRMRLDARGSVGALYGHLYVLEGSQLGGVVLARALAQRSELRAAGLEYLSGAGSGTRARFDAFASQLLTSLDGERSIADAISGARHAFQGVEAILDAVMSDRHEANRLSGVLNRDAGHHAVPSDLREVEAALLAGEQSYREWAYYGARYGERGLRFTRSDSAWLVTLAREDGARALQQVAWLGRVLAARGMPRLLLERHLGLLHATLIERVSERAGAYAALRAGAEQLAAERKRVIDDARFETLAAEFERTGPGAPEQGLTPREAGSLLVAAVVDEKLGVAKAVESLCKWLEDPSRFSEGWRNAVQHTLRVARAAR